MQPAADDVEERDLVISWWLVAAVLFAALSIALGFVGAPYSEVPSHPLYLTLATHGFVPVVILATLPTEAATFSVAAAFLVWFALLRPQWSDRALFSAALIVTGIAFFYGTELLVRRLVHIDYPSDATMLAFVTYGTWLVVSHASARRVWAAVCCALLLYAVVVPAVLGLQSYIASVGGALYGCAIVCLGLFVLERTRIDLSDEGTVLANDSA